MALGHLAPGRTDNTALSEDHCRKITVVAEALCTGCSALLFAELLINRALSDDCQAVQHNSSMAFSGAWRSPGARLGMLRACISDV